MKVKRETARGRFHRCPFLALLAPLLLIACIGPPPSQPAVAPRAPGGSPKAAETMAELDAWSASRQMSPGTNVGNTLENTTTWETGWGNPVITEEYVASLARLGFKTVRVPVAWDTYAIDEQIQADKMERVSEVVDWITGAGMFCVLNIHWDGGWIDSGDKQKFPDTHHTFSADAQRKFRSYWEQIATYFAGKNEKLIFEAINEETNFDGEGSPEKAYAALTRANQLFVDTVRKTGGNNARRLLIVTGYTTDIKKTCDDHYQLPKDTVEGRLFISVHYYTPWQFAGMTEDADWGKMMPTWGSPEDVKQLNDLFDEMQRFCEKNDIPAFIGEFNVVEQKESAERVRWLTSVANASASRGMVPVLWDTGGEVARRHPYGASAVLTQMLESLVPMPPAPTAARSN